MHPILLAFASMLTLAVVLSAGASVDGAEDRTVAAEARLVAEIRRMYGEAQTLLNRADYPAAEKGFFDCVALCQAAEPQVRDAAPLRLVSPSCLAAIDKLGLAKHRNEALGEWKRRFAALEIPQFRVRDAELGAVLERLRRRSGELAGLPPPSFTYQLPPAVLQRRITLDLNRVPLLKVLETVMEMGRLEAHFQQYAVLFTEAAVVKKETAGIPSE